jgi:N-acetylmuramic acid 6-phosphate etherase
MAHDTTTETVLALDLGKTGCRAALWVDGSCTEAEGAGAPGLATPGGVRLAVAAVLAVARPLLRGAGVARVDRACIGAAGALVLPTLATQLAERLAASLPAAEVAATSDAVTSHAGALGGGVGVVLAIGTGSVAVARSGGVLCQAGGWGPWLGDEGSGAWIGLHGLRAALRAAEGRGPQTTLLDAAKRAFGPLAGLPAAVDGAAAAAQFAPEVARAAEAGDAVAGAILREAAEHLAATARSAVGACQSMIFAPCVVVGGLARLSPLLMDRLEDLLIDADLALVSAQGTALDGARLLATRADLPHEAHVVRRVSQSGNMLDQLATEGVHTGLDDLDQRPPGEVACLVVQMEMEARAALELAIPQVAAAAEAVAARMRAGGRLFYLGAGTPGRLAVLDAAELGPTYSAPDDLVIPLMAGGKAAVLHAAEGAEDDPEAAGRVLDAHKLAPGDAVVGIAASGRTPFVVGGLRHARARGALTVAVVNNPGSPAVEAAEMAVEVLTGPELIAGSTRMLAGTSQKIVLNALSTSAMVALGKTYGSRMVDMRATNEKLRRRAARMVREITGAGEAEAAAALAEAGGRVKPAIVMLLAGVDAAEAERRLDMAGGRVREALR